MIDYMEKFMKEEYDLNSVVAPYADVPEDPNVLHGN